MMKITIENSTKVILVDDKEFHRTQMYHWWADEKNRISNEQRTSIGRFILNLHKNNPIEVDHKDLNRLNNQKFNLRHATRSQQIANMAKRESDAATSYKGI